LEVALRWAAGADLFAGVFVEFPTEVRAAQVLGLGCGSRLCVEQQEAVNQVASESGEEIDFGLNCGARGRGIFAQLQPGRSAVCWSRTAHEYTRCGAVKSELHRISFTWLQ